MQGSTETDVQLPPLPRLKLDELREAVDELLPVFRRDLGQQVTMATASRWAINVAEQLDHNQHLERLTDTFGQYCGLVVRDRFVEQLAWQVAARHEELRKGLILAYDRPTRREWVACEVDRIEDVPWQLTKAGTLFHLLALTGHPAGHMLKRKVPTTFLNWFSYQVGFTRRIRYDAEPRHFVGLRFWGFLEPRTDSPDVEFRHWRLDRAMRTHNQQLIRTRLRFEYGEDRGASEAGLGAFACPFQFNHLCWECPKRRNECPMSCLPR